MSNGRVLIPLWPVYISVIESALAPVGASMRRTTTMANGIIASYKGWVKFRQTCNELNRLTNRELADLGIERSEIAKVAKRSAAY